jgi:hypothetical protein
MLYIVNFDSMCLPPQGKDQKGRHASHMDTSPAANPALPTVAIVACFTASSRWSMQSWHAPLFEVLGSSCLSLEVFCTCAHHFWQMEHLNSSVWILPGISWSKVQKLPYKNLIMQSDCFNRQMPCTEWDTHTHSAFFFQHIMVTQFIHWQGKANSACIRLSSTCSDCVRRPSVQLTTGQQQAAASIHRFCGVAFRYFRHSTNEQFWHHERIKHHRQRHPEFFV